MAVALMLAQELVILFVKVVVEAAAIEIAVQVVQEFAAVDAKMDVKLIVMDALVVAIMFVLQGAQANVVVVIASAKAVVM